MLGRVHVISSRVCGMYALCTAGRLREHTDVAGDPAGGAGTDAVVQQPQASVHGPHSQQPDALCQWHSQRDHSAQEEPADTGT